MRETADDLAGAPAQGITMIGSLAERIPVWAPLTASNGPPTRLCTAGEPVAAGAGLLAAVRGGAAAADVMLPSAPVDPVRSDGTDAAYARFLRAARADPTSDDDFQGEA
jgi:hypothetical protein